MKGEAKHQTCSRCKSLTLTYSSSRTLSVVGELFNCPFTWSFNLTEASPEDFHREVTLPSLAAISRLARSQKVLVDLIKGMN